MNENIKTDVYQNNSSRYYALGLLTVVYSFNFIDRQLLAILQEPIKNDLLLSDGQLGLLTGFAFALFYVIAGLPIAGLADHSNRRNIISWSVAIWSFMTAITGLAQNFIHLLLARIGVGIGEAGCSPPAHSMISDIFPPEKRATALSIYSLGINIGILFGIMLGGWLAVFFGWRIAFFVVGAPGLILALVFRFTVKEPARGHSQKRTEEVRKTPFKEVIKLLWSRKSFRYIAIAGGFSAFAGYGMTNWLASFLIRVHHMGIGEVGSWLGLSIGVFGGLGTFLSGWFADKMGQKDSRWYMWIPAIASLVMIPFIAFAMLAENVYVHLALNMLPNFLSNVFLSVCIAMTHGLVGIKMRAVGSAVFFFAINLIGLGLGPVSIGYLSDYWQLSMGVESLRYSMLTLIPVAALFAAICYGLASRHLISDLEQAPH